MLLLLLSLLLLDPLQHFVCHRIVNALVLVLNQAQPKQALRYRSDGECIGLYFHEPGELVIDEVQLRVVDNGSAWKQVLQRNDLHDVLRFIGRD